MIHIEDGVKHIFPKDFQELLNKENLTIIDIRETYELDKLPYKKAIHIPMNALTQHYKVLLEKEKTYYILCHHGQRSYAVTEYLTNKGYNVINIVGGIDLVNRFDSL